MDTGTLLAILLGTPAVIALAKGIADFLRKERASIRIEADGKVIATGLRSEDAAKIAESISRAMRRN